MRFLLDTHAFLWWVEENPQLSDIARETIADIDNELFFSAASGWEIAIKSRIGKLCVPDNLEQFIAGEVHDNNFTVLPIQLSHTLHVYTLPLLHRDPFDRILIAQSNLEKMPLLTADPLISQYDVRTVW
ncbi:type II toxin-antitoxin system VapC family toxin [Chloroflexi bacterium TSY]|nr:type II toxin-antitoxin system VapC family toxin [Chloroflexi bacterium TSY]